ncbi:MAG: oligoendopeptidase F [Clostridia bacterium]
MKKRKELEEEYKWDLSNYFPSSKEWEEEFEEIKKMSGSFKRFEGKLNERNSILECLKQESDLSKRMDILLVWAELKGREDATSSENEERINKVSSLATMLSVETSFIEVEISDNDENFLISLSKDIDFSDFNIMLTEIIRFKPHILTKEEEIIVSQTKEFASEFSNVFSKFNDADLKFDKVKDGYGKEYELDHSNYMDFCESEDRILRKNAFVSMNNAYKKYNNTLSANYIASIKKNSCYAKLSKFSSAIEKSIFIEHASLKVYDTLIESVNKNLGVFHKYFDLKRKALGYKNYAIWDNFASLSSSCNLQLEFSEAIELIKKACSPLGNEYIDLIDKAVKEKWFDYGINEGKDSGAFSWGAYGKHPVILLSYQKNTNSVYTLAHEIGHSIHSYLSNHNLPYEKAGYEIFVAEVASNVNEMLLTKYLLSIAKEDKEKIFLYDKFLSEFRGSVFRQTMFAEFEQFAHNQYENNLPISSAVLNEKYMELNKQYFGKKVELLDEIAYEWSRIPHFYNAFYVYKYSTGLICAIALSKGLLEGGEKEKTAYIKFLSSGRTKPPVELLKEAGANLEENKTFDDAFAFAKDIIENWEKLGINYN